MNELSESFSESRTELLDNSIVENKDIVEKKEIRTLNTMMALRGLNLTIKHGEFICIIGDVGSGKSSLLSSIIGDLLYLDP